ncbi:glucosamine inositolphosphorylceramide transferase family protein [Algoriphagus yeomjeoni]|uniref:Glucosamine inositolphosphorylceramide transferase 1 N-terminal domain-containing protein n=1 Tax=Algoriphagus yeomjeoni TaxID=291403 RepID=A0A327NZR4_9BACT|nr:hypothetical protein [Algoriphagus yeomjeoni]RAI85595.1 hypothetical protein LV83_03675 [Algoriphagus yeomjeoni]
MRVVLLLDSLNVSAWVWEAVSQVYQEKRVEIVLTVINENPKASGKKSPFLYRAYRGFDRRLFLKYPDAFAQKELTSIQGWNIPILAISPLQKKYSDYFMEEDISIIKSYRPDIILRFGFRILRGEILKASTLGVWSFHHGDNQFYKGGPPAFWEVMSQKETTGVILQRLSEELDSGQILYKSISQTDPLSVQRNANKIFWLSSAIIPRVIRQINILGEDKWNLELQKLQPTTKTQVPLLTPPAFFEMLSLLGKLMTRNSLRKLHELNKKPYWEILVSENIKPDDMNFSELAFKSIQPPSNSLSKGSFWADPFPLEHNKKTWVFFEAFDGKTNKGKIVAAEWNGNSLLDPQTVLEESWHLSYPFIWEENNEFYMIPESGEAQKTFIYQAIDFPLQWKKIGVLMEGEAYDPTILKIDNMYWLFVNQRPHQGTSAFVELYAYHSPTLLNPDWTPHVLNPIVSDVRSSRPAGRIFKRNDKLYRPAQDSGLRYGHRIKIQEILRLSPAEYAEKTVEIIEPDDSKKRLGTHTFSITDKWIFSDAFYRR